MTRTKVLFWTAFFSIAALSFMPSYDPLPDFVSFSDILNHFSAFFILYTLHTFAFANVTTFRRITLFLAYGLFIEMVQSFLPTRDASLTDFAVDTVAITAAVAFQGLYRRLKPVTI